MLNKNTKKKYYISTFYKCFGLENIEMLESFFREELKKLKIIGTVILTPEGINSTIASEKKISLEKGIELIKKYSGDIVTKAVSYTHLTLPTKPFV